MAKTVVSSRIFKSNRKNKHTSIGHSANTRATNKSKKRSWKKYRGQG